MKRADIVERLKHIRDMLDSESWSTNRNMDHIDGAIGDLIREIEKVDAEESSCLATIERVVQKNKDFMW